MKRIFLTSTITIIAFLAQAHEFWLQPKKFRYKAGEEIKIDLMVGEGFEGEFWDLSRHKVVKFDLHRLNRVRDLTKEVKNTSGNILFKADYGGIYLFALQSNDAYIELEGDKFNEYLEEDGLDYILDQRKKDNTLDRRSTEYYTRFAKLLVQNGDRTDNTFKKVVGLRYEIVPEQNPYDLKAGDYLQCKVLYEGKPVPHALVKVWNRMRDTAFLQNIYTENDGTIRFPISAAGPWMVSSVKMIASEKEGAEYHSLWASLVFGIE
ncbi:MAG: DUF4198 domain-containing protein [Cyclobacteriaceae bacterium]|nr:DUF4198 domain-containing protein [Cyclobacteriaceae bacterium]